jgi:hypothetical protein
MGIYACGNTSNSSGNNPNNNAFLPIKIEKLTVKIVDQNTSKPIANALLAYNGNTLATRSNEEGIVVLSDIEFSSSANHLVLSAGAFDYASNTQRHSAQTLQERDNTVTFSLQKMAFSAKLSLPLQDRDVPAKATLQHGDTAMHLNMPFQSLVKANGEFVQGEIDVQITFYKQEDFPPNYIADDITLPTLLAQNINNGIMRLTTMGMADINLYQNGEKLQVAPGRVLNWSVQASPATAERIAQLPADNPVKLYFLNTANNFWEEDASAIFYDANTRTLNANLSHLTHINFDAELRSSGTCYWGKIEDQCGDPVPNQNLFFTFVGKNYGNSRVPGTGDPKSRLKYAGQFTYRPLKTNAQGEYCINAPLYSYDNGQTFDYAAAYAYPQAAKANIISGICSCPDCPKDDETQELLPSLNCYLPSERIRNKAKELEPFLDADSGAQGGNFSYLSTYITIGTYCSKKLYDQSDVRNLPASNNENQVPESIYQKTCYHSPDFLLDNPKQRCQACPEHFKSPKEFERGPGNRAGEANSNFYGGCDKAQPTGNRCPEVNILKIRIPRKICKNQQGTVCKKTPECTPGFVCSDNKCVCIDSEDCRLFPCSTTADCQTNFKKYIGTSAGRGIESFRCENTICVPNVP